MTTRKPMTETRYLVQASDGTIYETGKTAETLASICDDVRGQFSDPHRILKLVPDASGRGGTFEDVTGEVAYAIYEAAVNEGKYLTQNCEAYDLVANELNHAMAYACLSPISRAEDRDDARADYEMDRRAERMGA